MFNFKNCCELALNDPQEHVDSPVLISRVRRKARSGPRSVPDMSQPTMLFAAGDLSCVERLVRLVALAADSALLRKLESIFVPR